MKEKDVPQIPEIHLHLHVHEGASPEAVRAGGEALREDRLTRSGSPDDTPEQPDAGSDRVAEYIRRAYTESKWRAKPLLEFLADNPERLIPYTEVSDHLGFSTSRSLPGLLGSFSRRADHRYEGVQPFERRETLDGWCLFMSRGNAEIINSVR